MSIFISYSHENSEIVERIAANLVQRDIYIWIDKWQLNYGDSLIKKIESAITDCSALLIMLSKASIESEWCKKELTAGLFRELDEKRVVTIPILLEECTIPLFLRDKYYADFRGDFNQAIKNLHDHLLRITDITLNRVQVDKYFIDWALDDGTKDGQFWLNIDSVSFTKDGEYSVMCNIEITGNETITDQYLSSVESSSKEQFIDETIERIQTLDLENELKILIEDNRAKRLYFKLGRNGVNIDYLIHIYIRRLGINNGFDLLFDFGSIIRAIRKIRQSKYVKK